MGTEEMVEFLGNEVNGLLDEEADTEMHQLLQEVSIILKRRQLMKRYLDADHVYRRFNLCVFREPCPTQGLFWHHEVIERDEDTGGYRMRIVLPIEGIWKTYSTNSLRVDTYLQEEGRAYAPVIPGRTEIFEVDKMCRHDPLQSLVASHGAFKGALFTLRQEDTPVPEDHDAKNE